MLAVATFIILIYVSLPLFAAMCVLNPQPLHWTTIMLEKYWYMLWGIGESPCHQSLILAKVS